jgi:hypothetical protein
MYGVRVDGFRSELQEGKAEVFSAKSAACQLHISVSYLKYCIRPDSSAPVIMEWGMIACNTPALQAWWDSKKHHGRR